MANQYNELKMKLIELSNAIIDGAEQKNIGSDSVNIDKIRRLIDEYIQMDEMIDLDTGIIIDTEYIKLSAVPDLLKDPKKRSIIKKEFQILLEGLK